MRLPSRGGKYPPQGTDTVGNNCFTKTKYIRIVYTKPARQNIKVYQNQLPKRYANWKYIGLRGLQKVFYFLSSRAKCATAQEKSPDSLGVRQEQS